MNGGAIYGCYVGPQNNYYNGPAYGAGANAPAGGYAPSMPATPPPRAYLGISMSETPDGVVRVSGVRPNSPAERAGLLLGDALLAIDGREVFTSQDITRMVARHVPGEAVRLDIDRNGQNDQIQAVLASTTGPVATNGPVPTVAPGYENEAPYEVILAPPQGQRKSVEQLHAD